MASAESPQRVAPRRARHWWWLVSGAALIVAIGGWWVVAESARAAVHVVFDAQPLVCDTAGVGRTASIDDDEYLQPKVVLTDDASCRVRVHVLNDGWSDVNIVAVRLPFLGEDSEWGLTARFVNPNGQRPVMSDDRLDVSFPLDGPVVVASGSAALIEVVIDYRDVPTLGPCTAVFATLPIVEINSFGGSSTIHPRDRDVIWWQKGTDDACGIVPPSP